MILKGPIVEEDAREKKSKCDESCIRGTRVSLGRLVWLWKPSQAGCFTFLWNFHRVSANYLQVHTQLSADLISYKQNLLLTGSSPSVQLQEKTSPSAVVGF